MLRLNLRWLGGLAVCLVLAAGCVTVKVSLFEEPAPLKEKTISGYGRDKILLMDVSGVVLEGPHRILGLTSGVTSPSRIKEELEKASQDEPHQGGGPEDQFPRWHRHRRGCHSA